MDEQRLENILKPSLGPFFNSDINSSYRPKSMMLQKRPIKKMNITYEGD